MSNVPYLENTQVQTKELSDFWLAVYKLESDKNCDLIGVILPNGRKPPKLEGFLVYVDVICNQFLLSWCPRYFNYATFDDAVVKSAFSDHEVDEFRNEKNFTDLINQFSYRVTTRNCRHGKSVRNCHWPQATVKKIRMYGIFPFYWMKNQRRIKGTP